MFFDSFYFNSVLFSLSIFGVFALKGLFSTNKVSFKASNFVFSVIISLVPLLNLIFSGYLIYVAVASYQQKKNKLKKLASIPHLGALNSLKQVSDIYNSWDNNSIEIVKFRERMHQIISLLERENHPRLTQSLLEFEHAFANVVSVVEVSESENLDGVIEDALDESISLFELFFAEVDSYLSHKEKIEGEISGSIKSRILKEIELDRQHHASRLSLRNEEVSYEDVKIAIDEAVAEKELVPVFVEKEKNLPEKPKPHYRRL